MKGSERAPPGGARFVVTGQRRGGQQIVTSRTRRGGRTSEGGAGPLFLRCPQSVITADSVGDNSSGMWAV